MIYFVQSVDGGPIKIGWSSDVPTRIRQLEAHYGTPLAILATMPGEFDEEQAVHARFSHLRFGRTEQFRPAADLMAFIGRPLLVGANPDAVESLTTTGQVIIHLKGSTEYANWLDEFANETHIPKATLFRLAMAEYAKKQGRTAPPAR